MASRFVSGGAIDAASGEAVAVDALASKTAGDAEDGDGRSARALKKQEEWEAVQRELEAERRRREEQRAKMATGEERSLYDVLQANKAAKQAAFEEQARLKNQFRPLDDDEVDFLAGVRDAARDEEERLRRETAEGLSEFRRAQREREAAARQAAAHEAEEDRELEADSLAWDGPKRKRKREGDGKLVKGVVKRRASAQEGDAPAGAKGIGDGTDKAAASAAAVKPAAKTASTDAVSEKMAGSTPAVKAKTGISLVAYDSDSDDE